MRALNHPSRRRPHGHAGRSREHARASYWVESLECRLVLSGYTIDSLGLFGTNATGAHPRGGVAMDASGDLFGTTEDGGAWGRGTVFEIAHGGSTVTPLVTFTGANGANPYSAVTLDARGDIFGTTQNGGANNLGTVFEIPQGTSRLITIASFNGANGQSPEGQLVFDADGNLYGTTYRGGANNAGTVFELPRTSFTLTTLASFIQFRGGPTGNLAMDGGGNLFGTTTDDNGTVFELVHVDSTITMLALFGQTNSSPQGPAGGVVMDANGNLYGTTEYDLAGNPGSVFKVVHGSSTITTLALFQGPNGQFPVGSVVLDNNGNLYGTTAGNGTSGTTLTHPDGTVFELPNGSSSITTLASFDGTNGAVPYGGLILDGNGNLYGTTTGGTGGLGTTGTVFELPHGSSTITTVASLGADTGEGPNGRLVSDGSGNLYGTTWYGGDYTQGDLFEIASGSSSITRLASFTNRPNVDLAIDGSGNLYGTTEGGGANNQGRIFELARGSSTISTLATFDADHGFYPLNGVILDSTGNLYGTTTTGGGGSGLGTVVELPHGSSTITVLAPFTAAVNRPDGELLIDASGNLYGTTDNGAAGSGGTVFELTHGSSSLTVLASFNADAGNSTYPSGSLVMDGAGNLYGTTAVGGTNNDGTIFELAHGSSTITTLASFGGNSGQNSHGGLAIDSTGNLYGTTPGNTVFPITNGTVFELPYGSSTITTLTTFGGANGSYPEAVPILDGHGNLYGTTAGGGITGPFFSGAAQTYGTVFELSPIPVADTITGTSAADTIALTQAPDHHNIQWTLDGGPPSILPIDDPAGLTINANGGGSNDTITLDYSSGNPLPATIHFTGGGTFTINGLQNLNGTSLDIGTSTVYLSYVQGQPPVPISAFAASTVPSNPNANDPNVAGHGGIELGLKFASDAAGLVSAVRFYKGSLNTGTHSGELWTASGQLLASVKFTNETASGWQQASFSTPVPIAAHTTYIVSYQSTAPYLAYQGQGLASGGIDNGPLHILQSNLGSNGPNGVLAYDTSPGTPIFPASTNGQNPDYFVDVVFTANAPPPVDPIAMVRSALQGGYNAGNWNGTPSAASGVITSSAASGFNFDAAVGYADAADGSGVDSAPNTVELRATVYGDANLDGSVSFADLIALARHYNNAGSASWDQGDFTFDGSAGFADLLALAHDYGKTLASPAVAVSASSVLAPASLVPDVSPRAAHGRRHHSIHLATHRRPARTSSVAGPRASR